MSGYLPSLKNNFTLRRGKLYQKLNGIRPFELGFLVKYLIGVKRDWFEYDSLKYYLDPCTAFGQRLIDYGIYEPEMIESIKAILRPGDTFIDLGGNEAYFSLIAARHIGPSGKVFCIEPQERLWPTIIQNASANRISNIIIVPYGVSDSKGQVEITLYPSLNSGASSIVTTFRSSFYPRQQISLASLDALIEEYRIDVVDLIKIDIEGFEVNALRSASKALQSHKIKKLLIEIHPLQLKRLGQSEKDLFSLLQDHGYYYKHDGEIHLFSCEQCDCSLDDN